MFNTGGVKMDNKMWNTDKIKADIDCIELARDLGIDIKKKGNTFFCNCLIHNERTASMQINPKYLYCYGCGKSMNAFDICMNMLNLSFKEACNWLAEYLGSKEVYQITTTSNTNAKFPLTREDLEALGLYPALRKHLIEQKRELIPLEHNEFEFMDIRIDAGYTGIADLYQENKEAFWIMVGSKCIEQETMARRMVKAFTVHNLALEKSIFDENISKLQKIKKVKGKIPGKYLTIIT